MSKKVAAYNEIPNPEMRLLLGIEPGQETTAIKLQYHLFRHYKNIAERHFSLGRWHSLRAFRVVIRQLALEVQNGTQAANPGSLPEHCLSKELYARFIHKMTDIARAKQRKCRTSSRSVSRLLK